MNCDIPFKALMLLFHCVSDREPSVGQAATLLFLRKILFLELYEMQTVMALLTEKYLNLRKGFS